MQDEHKESERLRALKKTESEVRREGRKTLRSGLVYQKTGGGKSEKVSCPKNMKNVIHFKEVKKKPPPARFDINLKPPEGKTCS